MRLNARRLHEDNIPVWSNNSRLNLPPIFNCRGKSPNNSIICAIWSSSFVKSSPWPWGSKRYSAVRSSKTYVADKLQLKTIAIITYHTCNAPDVRSSVPIATSNNGFWCPILTCLNILCEMLCWRCGITEIRNLHRYRRDDVSWR